MTGTPENAACSSMDAASRPRRGVLAAAGGTAALAGLLFGFDTAVIAGVTHDLTRLFALTPETLGLTVSAAPWGTLPGALFSGTPGDALGGRDNLPVPADRKGGGKGKSVSISVNSGGSRRSNNKKQCIN